MIVFGGLLALINFCMSPLTCYAILDSGVIEPLRPRVKKLRQSKAIP